VKISVITVALNSAPTIVDTLRSVAAQTHPDVEHIIVDGGSTDGTLELIGSESIPVAKLISESDAGIYDAMNKGVSLAKGEIVGFLNSDDVFSDNYVLAKIAKAFCDPTIGVAYGDLVFVGRYDTDRVVRYWKSSVYTPGLCATGWMPPHPTLYARRSVYAKCGNFDLSFRLFADFEMALRMFEEWRVPSVYLPEVLVRMRMGGVSTRSFMRVFTNNREASRACRMHGFSGGTIFILNKLLAKLPQLWRRPA
jgi:glycosyltransferase involved in cell wall biosynthesis